MYKPRRALVALVAVLFEAAMPGALHAAAGDPIGGEIQVNTFTTGHQDAPSVASDGAGGFVVVWNSAGSGGTDTSDYSIQGQRFDAAGSPVGSEFQVNAYTTQRQRHPAVALAGDGFVVVWAGYGSGNDPSYGIRGRRFDAAGMPVGGDFQLNTYTTGQQTDPAVAADGAGGFVVAWVSIGSSGTDTHGGSVHARRFDAAGTPVGNEFQVNGYTTNHQDHPCVASDAMGGFIVIWNSQGSAGTDTSDASIQAQRFDETGTPVGGEYEINAYTTGNQIYPGIGSDGQGGFVALWTGAGATDTSGVQARRLDALGVPVGAEFQVNTYTTGGQTGFLQAVAPDGAGGFVIVWGSYGSTGTDDDLNSVQGRRFDAAGQPVGAEFQVNTYTTGYQEFAQVVPDGGGGFVVVWRSLGSAGTDSSDFSIQAQRFEGVPTRGSTTTTTTTSGAAPTSTTLASGVALAGRKLHLATKSGRPEKSKLALVAKDDALTLGRGNQSPDDPVVHGGSLTIASDPGDFSVTHALAGAWRYVGKVGQQKGYKWRSSTAPIRTVVIKKGKLVVAGKGPGLGFDLDGDPNPVEVALAIGERAYCLEFGGEAPVFKPNKLYRAKGAAAPASCP